MSLDVEYFPCSSKIPVRKNTKSKQNIFNRDERKREAKREPAIERKSGIKRQWQEGSILYETNMPAVKEKRMGMRGR
jgi:hypothetical protein